MAVETQDRRALRSETSTQRTTTYSTITWAANKQLHDGTHTSPTGTITECDFSRAGALIISVSQLHVREARSARRITAMQTTEGQDMIWSMPTSFGRHRL